MAARELAILVTAKNMASGQLRSVRSDITSLEGVARRTARNIAAGFAAMQVGRFVTNQVRQGIDSLVELERVQLQTAAVIESTGGAAGVTAEQIRRYAEELEALTTIDDKAIQNTENLLLTFTSIREEAFRPALETILDMNAAMGGGEEGLQGVAIQVGKALQDPVRGLTALRRVGVNFNQAQQDQIKDLVESNRLFEAQTMILQELQKEFGGSAEALGQGVGGAQRRFADAIEDMQMALAEGFLPLIERVSAKMQELVADPRFMQGVKDFGAFLASGFEEALDFAEQIPWGEIGDALALGGQGAKAIMDAFLAAPEWLQTAVLTGWGLNKLTGGAAFDLGKIVFDQFAGRGSTPVNPIFTKEVGLGGGGPDIPGGPGWLRTLMGAGSLGSLVTLVAGIATPFIMFDLLPSLFPGTPQKPGTLLHPTSNRIVDQQGNTHVVTPGFGQFMTGLMPSFPTHVNPANFEPPRPAAGGAVFGADAESADVALLRDFGGKLDKLATNEVIEHLARTTEMGLEGVGTSVEVGIKTGMDPVGDIATRILARAENPLDPPVMAEIKGHLLGLEEIQATYLAQGDIHLAAKVQDNIDTLHDLIGTQDESNAIQQRQIAEARGADAAMLNAVNRTKSEIASKGTQQIAKQAEALAAVRGQTGLLSQIRDKKSTINVTANVSVVLSAARANQELQSLRSTIGGGGFI